MRKPTHGQMRVLLQIARGLNTKEIAEAEQLSFKTVENIRHNLLVRTEAKNAAHLVAIAFRNGWIR